MSGFPLPPRTWRPGGDALFDRIGWHTSERTVETQAALDPGNAITSELKASNASAKRR
jgi:hypothetical protein